MNVPPLYTMKWTKAERSNDAIAETIEAKWKEAGHPEVRAWVEKIPILVKNPQTGQMMQGVRETIRSNLVRGLPPHLSRRAVA